MGYKIFHGYTLCRMIHALESDLSLVEFGCSILTAVPGIGIVGGGAKLILGSAQVIGGVATAAISFIANSGTVTDTSKRGVTHIVHGLGNIVSAVEGVPVIGSVSACFRFRKLCCKESIIPQNHSYLGYACLKERDTLFETSPKRNSEADFKADIVLEVKNGPKNPDTPAVASSSCCELPLLYV